jgi:twitching motility protein PilT
MDLTALLTAALKHQASDLHLSAGMQPMLRVHGQMQAMDLPALDADAVAHLLTQAASAEQQQVLATALELDFALALPGLGRFRVNAFMQSRGTAAVFRCIPGEVPTLAALGVPAVTLPWPSLRKAGLRDASLSAVMVALAVMAWVANA